MSRTCWLSLVMTVFSAPVSRGIAQTLPFPPPPTTAADAENRFDDRAKAVIEMNACGREDDYLRIRAEMAGDNFDSQGENLGHILAAKVAFIRAQTAAETRLPCSVRLFRSNVEAEAYDRLVRDSGPVACAKETGRVRHDGAPGVDILLDVTLECMSRQINESILAMRKTAKMGSSKVPCISSFAIPEGEFDVTIRELIRILYLSGPSGQRAGGILAPSTIDHMYNTLLAARGKVGEDSIPTVFGCSETAGDELGSPEDTADRHAWYNDLKDALGDFFEWALITYITYGVFPGGGALIVGPLLLSAAGADPSDLLPPQWDVRVPESENHRLNIESSRFLTNADIIARLEAKAYDRVGDVREDQDGVREWLLVRLRKIAVGDFQEYNARPYNRYSLNAILNLYDFAVVNKETEIATAAGIVLDLAEAKFAATSNRGRRIVPFRRLANEDGDESSYLHQSITGADHELARSMLLTGQTQTLDSVRGGDLVGTMAEMVNSATSRYRLPPPVLSAAVDRREYEQTIVHTGVERVEQSPPFTISAGGIRTGPTSDIIGFANDDDRGIAMPTVIIPTIAGSYMRDLFRFEGTGVHHQRSSNTCVAPGFACGLLPKFSTAFAPCTEPGATPQPGLSYVSSAKCFPAVSGPHFYLAIRVSDCPGTFCASGFQWGLMDIVEAKPPPAVLKDGKLLAADDPSFLRFQSERRTALNAATPDAMGNGAYTTARGLRIEFSMGEPGLISESPPAVLSVNGVARQWSTDGGVIQADGLGHATINGPGGPITIDFTDAFQPKRTP